MPWMQKQTRLTFERVGVTDPVDYDQYVATGGTVGLKKALQMEPSAIVEEVVDSGLRGRGGAGFPAGIKWRTVLGADADQKYIACNADEGDSGTYSDRMCMEGDPYLLIEGMVLAGLAAVRQDPRDRGERHHVVDHGRLAPQALERRQRRLGPHDAALALEAL